MDLVDEPARPDRGRDDPAIVMVTMTWDALPGRGDDLGAALARYVVLARRSDGCLNIDLGASIEADGRFVVVEKWHDAAAQRAHYGSALLSELAADTQPLLAQPPRLDLCDAISAHDLR